jgi:protein gp37
VPYCFKQWGAWLPREREGHCTGFINVGKRAAGRLLDGRLHDAIPLTV